LPDPPVSNGQKAESSKTKQEPRKNTRQRRITNSIDFGR
jgi:hypothetical protein